MQNDYFRQLCTLNPTDRRTDISTARAPVGAKKLISYLLLDMSHFLLVPVGGAAQGEHNLAPRVEPEIVQTRHG